MLKLGPGGHGHAARHGKEPLPTHTHRQKKVYMTGVVESGESVVVVNRQRQKLYKQPLHPVSRYTLLSLMSRDRSLFTRSLPPIAKHKDYFELPLLKPPIKRETARSDLFTFESSVVFACGVYPKSLSDPSVHGVVDVLVEQIDGRVLLVGEVKKEVEGEDNFQLLAALRSFQRQHPVVGLLLDPRNISLYFPPTRLLLSTGS